MQICGATIASLIPKIIKRDVVVNRIKDITKFIFDNYKNLPKICTLTYILYRYHRIFYDCHCKRISLIFILIYVVYGVCRYKI